jgi:hypothetical protein
MSSALLISVFVVGVSIGVLLVAIPVTLLTDLMHYSIERESLIRKSFQHESDELVRYSSGCEKQASPHPIDASCA